LEKLNDSEDIFSAWENIQENFKISSKVSLGTYGLRQYKLWFDEECLCFFRPKEEGSNALITASKIRAM